MNILRGFLILRKFLGFQRRQTAGGGKDVTSCRLTTLKNIFQPSHYVVIALILNVFMVLVPVLKVYVRLPLHLLLFIVFHVLPFFVGVLRDLNEFPEHFHSDMVCMLQD
jgi:hypothetical protein